MIRTLLLNNTVCGEKGGTMNDLIKRSDVEQMLTALGGCDASDKEAEGWDKAIDAAIIGLEELDSANE